MEESKGMTHPDTARLDKLQRLTDKRSYTGKVVLRWSKTGLCRLCGGVGAGKHSIDHTPDCPYDKLRQERTA